MVQKLLILVVLLFAVLNSSAQSAPVHLFSVSKTKKVVFSPGNLQYNTKTQKFQFAASQAECLGTSPSTIKDLFGWGMWLDEITDESKITNIAKDNSLYTPELNANNEFKNNKTTVNGTEWFTLSNDEWNYLLKNRANASEKYGVAMVDGVNGFIFLPDDFLLPDSLTFKSGIADDYGAKYYQDVNNYTAADWTILENNGAVFLPAWGCRVGTYVNGLAYYGYYWSSTARGLRYAFNLDFYLGFIGCYYRDRYWGNSVRLVRVSQN